MGSYNYHLTYYKKVSARISWFLAFRPRRVVEEWKKVELFDRYSVSELGQIRNDDTGRILQIQRNQHGVCYVGLMRGTEQLRRSLALLVAHAFVAAPMTLQRNSFTKPIHLDGNQANNKAYNLMWRPHWFAMKYSAQFKVGPTVSSPVIDIGSDERYSCPWIAALSFGLLEREVIISGLNRTFVWPTYQQFRFLEE